MFRTRLALLSVLFLLSPVWVVAQPSPPAEDEQTEEKKEEPKSPFNSGTFSGLKLRSIGPALTSGRVGDLAVDPRNRKRYFVAVASGGVWLTENAGTTWKPVFDRQSSYSIGTVVLDPNDPLRVWVGTGENNSQRSVSYGDGVYRSDDGGRSWHKKGLEKSEHIGKIVIDPRDSNTVYVAAQGPLWGPGGERGLYKTTDGGDNWEKVLEISENTGVTDVVLDPRNPDTLYAASYQRRRRVWTMINGGPESAIHKSTDAGKSWKKLSNGLPGGDKGRIGLAISPVNPDVLYAWVEAAEGKGGIFRSQDRGASWKKQNSFDATAFYYGEIVADPVNVDRIYIPNTFLMVSDDGGATVRRLGQRFMHVDSHALWIDPQDTDYYLVGCDGGIYESFDRGQNWHFKANLPITQFYDVAVDNSEPFYYVYGGTQDNFTLGGPSRTRSISGIVNSDWFVVRGGDGFKAQIDPTDPNIVYAEAQYGELVRFNRETGERLGIKPVEEPGEDALRWNWDSPLLISPHSPSRLYFSANKLFRSDDRGASWTRISGELSRAIDPNTLEVMGRIWPPEAVAKGSGTSQYGNATALAESPLVEGLLYIGTDDGLIQVSETGGEPWRKVERFDSVPEMTYVTRIVTSTHSPDRVYVAFDNHKNNDFKPYLVKSEDRGRSWSSIVGDLPENGPVLALAEDPVNPDLLFAGTEFGLFFTVDRGQQWVQLKGGIPTIAVRDLAIQPREVDLVAATFGRGFYILDDYSPLRHVDPSRLEEKALLFEPREALLFVPTNPLGGRDKAFQGSSFFTAENPPYGALMTYYLKESLQTKKQQRQEQEKKNQEDYQYPALEDFRKESEEEAPKVTLTIRDQDGNLVRRIDGPTSKGVHRVSWNLRQTSDWVDSPEDGPLVLPGRYTVSLSQTVEEVIIPLAEAQEFMVESEGLRLMPPEDRLELEQFHRRLSRLSAAARATLRSARETRERLEKIRTALQGAPMGHDSLVDATRQLQKRLTLLYAQLQGDDVVHEYGIPQPPSLMQRVGRIGRDLRQSSSRPTQTHRTQIEHASRQLASILEQMRQLVEVDLSELEMELDRAGIAWTPGRLPEWPRQ